ncbi:Dabb family protein [Ilyomonas limi]|uniref:Dabb family protein n=1 Tax=Ilyomonas limi TaxID=2575867 RepID=A0A4U3L1A8_9BACT|nr:Dabb family protein [Ilyomonas limi]TKK67266.1 Dabb family protein [Ilyomonas limi]
MKTRRAFLTSAAVLGAAAVVSAKPFTTNKNMKQPLIHHAIFWLKNPGSVADRDKLVEGVKTLSGISKIKQLYVGTVANTEKRDVVDQSWGVSEIMFFDNLEDQASYQSDPIHQSFVKNYSHLWEKVVVYDAQTV